MFLAGAVILIREGRSHQAAEGTEIETKDVHGVQAVIASFLVLFAAEWGDLSQLLTMSQVARTHEPVSVFIGSWSALLLVSGLAVLAGRVLLRYLRLSVLHYVGAGVCAVFAVLTVLDLAGV
jgi:putative Ca2+/H+ antiporter (TMEM165/GDT1 family)